MEVASEAMITRNNTNRLVGNGKALLELTSKHGVILHDTPADYFTEYMNAAQATIKKNAEQNAFYYARLIETPSCRWSTQQCQAAGVNPFSSDCEVQKDEANMRALDTGATGPVYDNCCRKAEDEPFYSPVIRERAWSSPIWVAGPR